MGAKDPNVAITTTGGDTARTTSGLNDRAPTEEEELSEL